MEEKEAFDAYLKNNFDMNPIDILPQGLKDEGLFII